MKVAASLLASDFARLGEEVEKVSRSGADFIHVDVMDGFFVRNITMGSDIIKAINAVKSTGKKVGVAIKPTTLVDELLEYLPMIDLAVVMTVEPGFGGQAFMPEMMSKVRVLREEIRRLRLETQIEVDGGINKETAKMAAQSGADICVAGTSIFKSSDMTQAIAEIKGV